LTRSHSRVMRRMSDWTIPSVRAANRGVKAAMRATVAWPEPPV